MLRAIAGVLQASVRAEDIVCRCGGEEFTVILPDMTPEAAQMRATAICTAVNDLRSPLERSGDAQLAASIGIALFPAHGMNPKLLLRRADEALYLAKRTGRNRALIYGSEKTAEVSDKAGQANTELVLVGSL